MNLSSARKYAKLDRKRCGLCLFGIPIGLPTNYEYLQICCYTKALKPGFLHEDDEEENK